MLRDLSDAEVTGILARERMGRLSCYCCGRQFLLPVAFHTDGVGHICLDTADELWRNLLKARSRVCFEVDRLEGPAQWETVLGWGEIEADATDACPRYHVQLSSLRGFHHGPDDSA